jgi:rhomboid protease GluP
VTGANGNTMSQLTGDDGSGRVWHCVLRSQTRAGIDEASFVLTAVGVEHHIGRDGWEWSLWTPDHAYARARQQLEQYRIENLPAGRPRPMLPVVDSGWPGVIGFLLVIWMLPTLEAQMVFGWDWREAGHMQAGRVMAGEWWRTITALTLHGDIAHLLGNSIFGGLFGWFLGRTMGSGVGWLLVVLCGALGNGLNAWLQADAFRSVGASTANFAALGLLSAFIWRRGYFRNVRWQRSFAPIAAGIALLAFTGVGGENTDIVAHFTGFTCGIACGVLVARVDLARLGAREQWLAGAAALVLIAIAWLLAGSAGAT